ncbi:unnamed protein product [Durusdinium trenchii]
MKNGTVDAVFEGSEGLKRSNSEPDFHRCDVGTQLDDWARSEKLAFNQLPRRRQTVAARANLVLGATFARDPR